jgi:hypothetical protein
MQARGHLSPQLQPWAVAASAPLLVGFLRSADGADYLIVIAGKESIESRVRLVILEAVRTWRAGGMRTMRGRNEEDREESSEGHPGVLAVSAALSCSV